MRIRRRRRKKNDWVITDRAIGWMLAIVVLTIVGAAAASLLFNSIEPK